MMKTIVSLLILCFMAGCAPSMVQHRNLWQVVDNRTDLSGYSKNYIIGQLGMPYGKKVSRADGKCVETWAYETSLGHKFLLLNTHPVKTVHMKLTMENGIVSKCDYE